MSCPLPQLEIVKAVTGALREGPGSRLELVGPWGSAKTLIPLQAARALDAPLLVVTAGRIESEEVFEDLATFAGPDRTAQFPAWEVLPMDAISPADDIVAERMHTLRKLAATLDSGEPSYTVLPVRSFLQRVIEPRRLMKQTISLSLGDEVDRDDLLDSLAGMGYHREVMVEKRGEMSVRGCILDVFPISSELPYRIEFFGDEIESIRRFEPETQRSVGETDAFDVLPRSEKTLLFSDKASLAAITDYIPKNTIVAIDDPMAVLDEAERLGEQFADNPFFMQWEEAARHLSAFARLDIAQVACAKSEGATRLSFPIHSVSMWTGNLGGFWEQLGLWDRDEYSVVVLCNNTGERRRLLELLEDKGYRPGEGPFDLSLEIGRIRAGFCSTHDRLAVLSEREIFGRHYVRRARRRFEAGAAITAFSDLKAGDFIVHAIHGIGRYEGLKRFRGKPGDFLAIKYVGGDTLYVPVARIDLVQKYMASDTALPKLDRLGGKTWARTKARVKKAIREMTEELIKLYAAREVQVGHAFAPDAPWQREFEDAFEYDETPDQRRAIAEVKADMEEPKPMDRLLCGDVGFGKTEVALRAAFKSVLDGRQVALLAPTTILVEQHFTTFTERLADYPVRVEMLSRFTTPKQQKRTVECLKSGEVDIVIGTHRLVSKDIAFKNLGLIIIDEEHRFGVAQKERLKQLRTSVDVLTLSATPIPRTLQFSLMGVRDMSSINTAPNDRLPIHTCIEAFDEDLIQEAIEREIGRQGQVFFLHNRVQTIESMAGLVQRLVPAARVAIGHGQMPERQLERVMAAFIRRETDVLVCTTIIGSGLDIPNANTIIIDRADRFGLAELYQLRGRVGRYKHRAFAYLLIAGERALTRDAQERLKALEEFSVLGSGFTLAMRDLEIRGSGNILGVQQHGQIATVGYDTYMQLIKEAVAEQKGEPIEHRVLPPFEGALDAHIPEEYVPVEAHKITLYKRIAGITTLEDADEMLDELTDRFGRPPAPVRRLVDVMRARAHAFELGAKSISATKHGIVIDFGASSALVGRRARNQLTEIFGNRIEFGYENRPAIRYIVRTGEDPVESTCRLTEAMADL